MIRVGQCENCEYWFRARHLEPARVARPTLAARERRGETFGDVPGLEPEPETAYFCHECMEALKENEDAASLIWKPGDPVPEELRSPRRRPIGTAAGVGSGSGPGSREVDE